MGGMNISRETYTVEAETAPGQVDPDDTDAVVNALHRYPEYLERYGVRDAAVVVTEKGSLVMVGQTEADSHRDAIHRVGEGWSFMPLLEVRAYRGGAG